MTAGLWFFLLHWLTSYPKAKPTVEPLKDPEMLLGQALEQMRECQVRNRTRAVEAITQKNNLVAERDKTRPVVERLLEKSEAARAAGDQELGRQLLIEADRYQASLVQMEATLERATKTTEAIKDAIRREEERIRTVTAETMAAKVEWRQGQISASIEALFTPAPPDTPAAQARLDAVLKRVESTRDALWREAQAASKVGSYEATIRLLAMQQNLELALVFGSNRR